MSLGNNPACDCQFRYETTTQAAAAGSSCPDSPPDGLCDDYTAFICGNIDQSRCSDGDVTIDGWDAKRIGGLGGLCTAVNLFGTNTISACGKEAGQAFRVRPLRRRGRAGNLRLTLRIRGPR